MLIRDLDVMAIELAIRVQRGKHEHATLGVYAQIGPIVLVCKQLARLIGMMTAIGALQKSLKKAF